MPRPDAPAIHATALSIAGRAVVIRGASGAGKSSLAAALLAHAGRGRRIRLIGDDRVLLAAAKDGALEARPHPRTAGFIERRGLGLVAVPFCPAAPVAALVELAGAPPRPPALGGVPVLALADRRTPAEDARRVLAWWDAGCGRSGAAADSPHPRRKRA